MTTLYASKQSSALATLQRKGAAITFTLRVDGTPDPTTGDFSGATTIAVSGYAVEDEGDPTEYEALELTKLSPVTLLFASNPVGSLPALGSVGTWGGVAKTVKRIRPVQPDGAPIVAYVVA